MSWNVLDMADATQPVPRHLVQLHAARLVACARSTVCACQRAQLKIYFKTVRADATIDVVLCSHSGMLLLK
jgi:hypothetical protein